jgi:DNA-binding transcriptional MocR family regulator
MTIWSPDIGKREGPVYRAIADAIAQALEAGELQPGEGLPTHRALARALGVTVGTVSRGYAEAERRGMVVGEVGRGTFVRGGEPGGPADLGEGQEGITVDMGLPSGHWRASRITPTCWAISDTRVRWFSGKRELGCCGAWALTRKRPGCW